MDLMDIFHGDAFNIVSMTYGIIKQPYVPNLLGSLGIFNREPIRNLDAAIAMTDEGELTLVPTTPRGAPPIQQKIPTQNIRSFRTPRIAVADHIQAHELQSIVARYLLTSGAPDGQLIAQDLAAEIDYRLNGPNKLRAKVEATKEFMRLGALSGVVLDATGSVLYDWGEIFGVTPPAEIAFNLTASNPTPGALANLVRQTERSILRAAKLGNVAGASVMAICGDQFFDDLVTHPDVISAYNLYQAQQAGAPAIVRLQAGLPDVPAFSTFRWANVDWINYRGTDDNTTIAIESDKCKLIPRYPGMFSEILAPYEAFPEMNTPGLPEYVRTVPDMARQQFVDLEVYSYPMYVARRPDLLFSGRAGS